MNEDKKYCYICGEEIKRSEQVVDDDKAHFFCWAKEKEANDYENDYKLNNTNEKN